MSQIWWVTHPEHGSHMATSAEGQALADCGYGEGWVGVKIDREADTRFETVNPKSGKITVDEDAKQAVEGEAVDAVFRQEHGDMAIDIMHLRKALEARARDADPDAPAPMLEAEATATGVALDDLVAQVIEHDDAAIGLEVARRQAKGGE